MSHFVAFGCIFDECHIGRWVRFARARCEVIEGKVGSFCAGAPEMWRGVGFCGADWRAER